jgi:hypothetical protein
MHGDVDADRGPNREPYMVRMAICRQILEGATMQCRPGHRRFYTQHEAGRTTHVREIAGSHAGLAKRCSPSIPSEKNGWTRALFWLLERRVSWRGALDKNHQI